MAVDLLGFLAQGKEAGSMRSGTTRGFCWHSIAPIRSYRKGNRGSGTAL